MVILPVIPRVFDADFTPDASFIVGSLLILFLSIIASLAIAGYTSGRFDTDRKKTAILMTVIAVCVTVIMICFFGCSAIAVKGILLASILAFSSYEDVKTRECDDHLHLMIVIAAFIGTDIQDLPGMILAVIVNVMKKNRKAGFPMIPYLAAGFTAAYFIRG